MVSFLGERLDCVPETANRKDPYAVSVQQPESRQTIVGHLPRKISAACSMFVRKGGTITCTISGERRYSGDLPQGGLEVPCYLSFVGSPTLIEKLTKALTVALPSGNCRVGDPPERKKQKIDITKPSESEEWLYLESCHLKLNIEDKLAIERQERLNDKHMNFAQALLQSQYPDVEGLCCTLLQHRLKLDCSSKTSVQILHVHGNHWITVSNVNCPSGEVQVYDSIYSSLNKDVEDLIQRLFDGKVVNVTVASGQKQQGTQDCGLFAIATATSLLSSKANTLFQQSQMRPHLITCYENFLLTPFP